MRISGIIPILLLLIGILFIFIGYISGELEAGIFIIFPILIGSGPFAFIGFVCIFLSFISFFFIQGSYFNQTEEIDLKVFDSNNKAKHSIKGGGVVFIGPIPIVFGSSWKIAIFLLMIAAILLSIIIFVAGFWQ
jgi:uncharacterized protein (TIGR00304 family)